MTVYTFDENIISDLHKDAFGFRPSATWYEQFAAMSDDEKQEEWDYLLRALERSMEEEARREKDAIFEFDCLVRRYMELGAANRETAIRWILDSMELGEYDLMYGGSFVCYELGLPYSFASEFNPIVREMLANKEVAE